MCVILWVIFRNMDDARHRAFAIVSKFVARSQRVKSRDVVCTIRDVGGHKLIQVRIESGEPVVSAVI